MITRNIQKELLVCAKEYPSVTILGPRQSGKTTLAKMAFPKHSYCSLEDPDVRVQAQNDPRGLLGSFSGGVILDEIQRVPQLLSYLQGILTNWFVHGLSEFDVMTMAGHSSFETTRRFYLAIRNDLLDRARSASSKAMSGISVANLLQMPFSVPNKKCCQTQVLDSQGLTE